VSSSNGRGSPDITRFKGLGEMMPRCRETTLNPKTRRLLRVEVIDQTTDRVINELMGKDVGPLPVHHGPCRRRTRIDV
jgi:DNA gyrase/topoisomerase IV subunit B